jgi:hypothetical protein
MKEIGCRSCSPHELLLSTSRLSRNNSTNEIANKIQCIEGMKMSPITEHKSWGVGGMEHSIKWKCPSGASETEICIICSNS